MILATSDEIPGRRILKSLGIVRGNTVRCRHLGHDIMAKLRNLVGGEIEDYTKLMAEAREQAMDRLANEAAALGGDAVITIRFSTSEIAGGAAEILVYGTAVVLAPENVQPSP